MVLSKVSSYDDWCEKNNCQHGHCPDECEHPQPLVRDGILYCGRCWFKYKELVEMVPCTPKVC